MSPVSSPASRRALSLRLLSVGLVVAAALVATPAPAATPATKYGTQIVVKVNKIRLAHDRARLKRDRCLQRFANRHAKAMADARSMFHQDDITVMVKCGLSSYGENVAYGMFTSKQMVDLWMTSKKGHKQNILYGGFRITGASARHADGVWWATQVFGRR